MNALHLALWSVGCAFAGFTLRGWWEARTINRQIDRLVDLVESTERDAQTIHLEGDVESSERCFAYARGMRHGALMLVAGSLKKTR